MHVIVSHHNVDFDGLGSMIAAKKLTPDAVMAVSEKLDTSVTSYMAIFRDQHSYLSYQEIRWEDVTTVTMVDVAQLNRTGIPIDRLNKNVSYIVYDHHPPFHSNMHQHIEEVGATITLLLEKIKENNLSITQEEVTLFGLGLYSDTGNFTFDTTTVRDFQAAAFLMENGLDIELVQQFISPLLSEGEKELFQSLYKQQELVEIDGLSLVLTYDEIPKFQNGLGSLAEKLLETNSADAVIAAVKMGKHTHISCRASSSRINFQPFVEGLGGGGHPQAASAMLKKTSLNESKKIISDTYPLIIDTAIKASDMMSSPVKTMDENDSIDEAKTAMIRFGHTGFPVLNDSARIVGVISRRDVDKALHHGYGHSPVKGYMTRDVVTLSPDATLELIQKTMITHNIGRIPIIEKDKVIGIVSRTNVIAQLQKKAENQSTINLSKEIKSTLQHDQVKLLEQIGQEADRYGVRAFIVGGFVRDLLLGRPNEDLDIVIEGDGIEFANRLFQTFGGEVTSHEQFGTATWTTNEQLKIDIVTCRTEFYSQSAALPTVLASNIHEDLTRRDFTINAMAMFLSKKNFGELVDDYNGYQDLKQRKIRILHSLSFIEDPTRIFRAVRFATRFGYSLDEDTVRLAKDASQALPTLSETRMLQELKLIRREATDSTPFKILNQLNVWETLLGTKADNSCYLHIDQLLMVEWTEAFHLLLAICYRQENIEHMVSPFLLTSKWRTFAKELELVQDHLTSGVQAVTELHKKISHVQNEVLSFILLDPNHPHHDLLQCYMKKRAALIPFITGQDLIIEGLKPGPIFKELLFEVELLQLDEKVKTKEEALSWIIQRYKKEEASQ